MTDDEKDLLKLKDFISSLNNVEKIELIAYHKLGKYKWEQLGYKYELENIRSSTEEDISRVKKILDI